MANLNSYWENDTGDFYAETITDDVWAINKPNEINDSTTLLMYLHGGETRDTWSWEHNSEAFREFVNKNGEDYNLYAFIPRSISLGEDQVNYFVNFLKENDIKNMIILGYSNGAMWHTADFYLDLLEKTDDVHINLMLADGGFRNFNQVFENRYDLLNGQNIFFFEGLYVHNYDNFDVAQNIAKAGGNIYFFQTINPGGNIHNYTDLFASESLDFFLNPDSEYNLFDHFYISTLDSDGNEIKLTTVDEIRTLAGMFNVTMTDDEIYQIELEAANSFANYEILCKDEIIKEELSKLKSLYVGTNANSQFTSYGSTTRMPNIIGQCVNEINKRLAGMLVDIEKNYKIWMLL